MPCVGTRRSWRHPREHRGSRPRGRQPDHSVQRDNPQEHQRYADASVLFWESTAVNARVVVHLFRSRIILVFFQICEPSTICEKVWNWSQSSIFPEGKLELLEGYAQSSLRHEHPHSTISPMLCPCVILCSSLTFHEVLMLNFQRKS